MKTPESPGCRLDVLVNLLAYASVILGGGVLMPVESNGANIAREGTGIMGVNDGIDNDGGTPRLHSGIAGNIVDSDPATRIDNWFGDGGGDNGDSYSFVGVLWDSPRTDYIQNLTLVLATFSDGGWFGVAGFNPGAGGELLVEDLLEPDIQVTTDGGASWTTVGHSSNYIATLSGHTIGGGANPNPTSVTAEFDLEEGQTGINGIRIIGENGGSAGADSNGFIGVFELFVAAGASADDSDADGLTDDAEISTYMTNPELADTDGDGLLDGDEVLVHLTNPLLVDSDGDGFSDRLEITQLTDPTKFSSSPGNFALTGRGIIGTNDAIDDDEGTFYEHVGVAASINDGSSASRVDTWNDTGADTASFVGIEWESPVPQSISALTLTLATFVDGGWFGTNGSGPAPGEALDADFDLVEPSIQVSTDSGTTWTTVPHSSDYLEVMSGHLVGGGTQPNPSIPAPITFTLESAQSEITGIRIIGEEGGAASGGFIGVIELAITIIANEEDVDGDGLDDTWEADNGFVVGVDESGDDADGDTLSNLAEFEADSDPNKADTDDDGLDDAAEIAANTGLRDPDSDDDGLTDGEEILTHFTNPLLSDSDGDGLGDLIEAITLMTNPQSRDTDGDGFPDGIEVAQATDPKSAASAPSNYALIGTGILGTVSEVSEDSGTSYVHSGVAASITDGDLLTRVDTFDDAGGDTASFVGVEWDDPRPEPLGTITLTLAIFFDGGWFGTNGNGPGSGGTLDGTYLREPTIQVSRDGGATWTTSAHTSDYLTAFDGAALPDVDFGPPTTYVAVFKLDRPESAITGIRIIGEEGGTASNGFIGVWELAVEKGTSASPFEVSGLALNTKMIGSEITMSWNSAPERTYSLFWGTDLITFDGEIADSIPSGGETTVYTFPNPAPELREIYFRAVQD
ncbi:MAG: hypothetical protein KDN22_31220 [Verrucomicrobiae bacterium]|nr:hypothetical protein [Verrucomicrobiae bacterium]